MYVKGSCAHIMKRAESNHWIRQELETYFAAALTCNCDLCVIWYRVNHPPKSSMQRYVAYASFPHMAQTTLRRAPEPRYHSTDDLPADFPKPVFEPRTD